MLWAKHFAVINSFKPHKYAEAYFVTPFYGYLRTQAEELNLNLSYTT